LTNFISIFTITLNKLEVFKMVKFLSAILPGAHNTGKTTVKTPAAEVPGKMANGRKVNPEGSSVVPAGLKPTARPEKTSQPTIPARVTVLSAASRKEIGEHIAYLQYATDQRDKCVAEAKAARERGDAARAKAKAADDEITALEKQEAELMAMLARSGSSTPA
jgi:hypothetical protein